MTSSVVDGGGGGALGVFGGLVLELVFEATVDSVGFGKLGEEEEATFAALVG